MDQEVMIMKLLNTKSIVDCDELEELMHNEETKWLISQLKNLPNYECIVLKKQQGQLNGDEDISMVNLYHCLDVIEDVDFKNGIDLTIGDNNIFTIVAYGRMYKNDNQLNYYKTYIYIMPYDKNREFLDISSVFQNMNIEFLN